MNELQPAAQIKIEPQPLTGTQGPQKKTPEMSRIAERGTVG